MCSSEERLSQRLSMFNPKPRFSASFESKTDANDARPVSCPRGSERMGSPSSVLMGVCGPEVVQTEVMDEGVQEVERRVGVGQFESSNVKDMGDEGIGVTGDEKEKSFCKLSIEKRRLFILRSVVTVGIGEPALSRASSCRGSLSYIDKRQDKQSVADEADTKLLCVGDEVEAKQVGSDSETWVDSSREEIEEQDLRDGEINSWERILEPRRDTEGVGGGGGGNAFVIVGVTMSE